MKHISFLIKAASSLCNLRCRYCYYKDEPENRKVKSMGIMTEKTAGQVIQKAFAEVDPGGSVSFMFQGGKPTLDGIDFYRRFLALEQIYEKVGGQVFHAMQTDTMTITREWTELFQQNHFLVGISIDGNSVCP